MVVQVGVSSCVVGYLGKVPLRPLAKTTLHEIIDFVLLHNCLSEECDAKRGKKNDKYIVAHDSLFELGGVDPGDKVLHVTDAVANMWVST
jgi:hypothetical protein